MKIVGGKMSFLGFGISNARANELAELSIASYDQGVPPDGWRALPGSKIGLDARINTRTVT